MSAVCFDATAQGIHVDLFAAVTGRKDELESYARTANPSGGTSPLEGFRGPRTREHSHANFRDMPQRFLAPTLNVVRRGNGHGLQLVWYGRSACELSSVG